MQRMRKALFLVLAAALIFAVLVLPNHPAVMRWSALSSFPLELPVILLAMIVVGRAWFITLVMAFVLVIATFLKLADYGMFVAYGRNFNPILDTVLIGSGVGLLRDSIGTPLAVLAIVCVLILLVGLVWLLFKSLNLWARLAVPPLVRLGAGISMLVFGGWAVADAAHDLEYERFKNDPPGTAWTSKLVVEHAVEMRDTAIDLAEFSRAARNDIYANDAGLLNLLKGQDVIIIYVESYGRASFDNPLYAPTHIATLDSKLGPLEDAGFAVQSGWLSSPITGGQSWLAHGTLSSGLWTSDNGRYNAMLASGRKSLFHIAQNIGFRTAAVMPGIKKGWPESAAMGFDQILPAAGLNYKGERFHWVTMPDQFTLAKYADVLGEDSRADFIQIALISSHTPWTPLPDAIPWDNISDGTEFNEMAARGPTPRELWKDHDNVRDAYRRALDYSLQVTFEYIAQQGENAPLVFVVGDHQAWGYIAGSDNHDVPMHVIGPPELVARLNDWGWQEGLIPGGAGRRMDSFRNDFISAFTDADIAERNQ